MTQSEVFAFAPIEIKIALANNFLTIFVQIVYTELFCTQLPSQPHDTQTIKCIQLVLNKRIYEYQHYLAPFK